MTIGKVAKKAISRLESSLTSPYTAGVIGATGVATNTFMDSVTDTMSFHPYNVVFNAIQHVGEKSIDSLAHLAQGEVGSAISDAASVANVQNELYSRLFNAQTLEQISSIAEHTPYIAGGLLAYRASKWGVNKAKEYVKNKKERKQHKKLSRKVPPIDEAVLNATAKTGIGYGLAAGATYGVIDHVQDKLEPLNYMDATLGVGKTAADITTGGMGTVASQVIDSGRYLINDGIEVTGGLFAANKWGDMAGELTQKAMYFIDKFPSEQLPNLGLSAAIIGGLGLAGKYVANKMKKDRTKTKKKH